MRQVLINLRIDPEPVLEHQRVELDPAGHADDFEALCATVVLNDHGAAPVAEPHVIKTMTILDGFP